MLPVLGQDPPEEKAVAGEEGCSGGDCCAPGEAATLAPVSGPETLDGSERSVVRVTGMDCASCAVTVEKGVARVPGVRRATVNFAAGRLDAEHDPGVWVEEIERAVEGAGDGVFSGSLNGQGGLLVRVTREAKESTLQKVARLVEEAQAKKAPAEQFVDRFSRVYTPIVVAAAVGLAAGPPLLGGDFGPGSTGRSRCSSSPARARS